MSQDLAETQGLAVCRDCIFGVNWLQIPQRSHWGKNFRDLSFVPVAMTQSMAGCELGSLKKQAGIFLQASKT